MDETHRTHVAFFTSCFITSSQTSQRFILWLQSTSRNSVNDANDAKNPRESSLQETSGESVDYRSEDVANALLELRAMARDLAKRMIPTIPAFHTPADEVIEINICILMTCINFFLIRLYISLFQITGPLETARIFLP